MTQRGERTINISRAKRVPEGGMPHLPKPPVFHTCRSTAQEPMAEQALVSVAETVFERPGPLAPWHAHSKYVQSKEPACQESQQTVEDEPIQQMVLPAAPSGLETEQQFDVPPALADFSMKDVSDSAAFDQMPSSWLKKRPQQDVPQEEKPPQEPVQPPQLERPQELGQAEQLPQPQVPEWTRQKNGAQEEEQTAPIQEPDKTDEEDRTEISGVASLEEQLAEMECLTRQEGERAGRGAKGKWTVRRIVLLVLTVLLILLLAACVGGYIYLSRIFNPNVEGGGGQLVHTQAVTPPQLAESQINFLVLGLDYLEDAAERSEETMMTDMILYCQFDREAQTLKMLQVPRDAFVERAEDTDQTGKINALYSFGPDSENKVQNLVDVFYETFQLPVDYYITIQMEALVEFVNTFGGGGGIEVYVPQDIFVYDDNGGQVYNEDGSPAMLPQGYQMLRGEELELFLRARKGPGMERSDFDRLNNQRYFYSALFRYVRTMSVPEMVRLMPVCVKYINTNMPMTTCIALALEFLSGGVPDENILIGRVPMYSTGVYYTDSTRTAKPQVSIIAAQQTADFLNKYFRPSDTPVPVEELDIRTCGDPSVLGAVVEAEMSRMGADGQVQQEPVDTTESPGAEPSPVETGSEGQAQASTAQETGDDAASAA